MQGDKRAGVQGEGTAGLLLEDRPGAFVKGQMDHKKVKKCLREQRFGMSHTWNSSKTSRLGCPSHQQESQNHRMDAGEEWFFGNGDLHVNQSNQRTQQYIPFFQMLCFVINFNQISSNIKVRSILLIQQNKMNQLALFKYFVI